MMNSTDGAQPVSTSVFKSSNFPSVCVCVTILWLIVKITCNTFLSGLKDIWRSVRRAYFHWISVCFTANNYVGQSKVLFI